jgi:hypothetical protein
VEEVEGKGRHHRGDGARSPAADDGGNHDREHQDQGDIRVVDLATHPDQDSRDDDRQHRAQHQPDRLVDSSSALHHLRCNPRRLPRRPR